MTTVTPAFSSLALDAPTPPDWVEVTVEAVPAGLPDDPERWAREVFDLRSASRLVSALMALRQLVVPLLGVRPAEPDVFAVDAVRGGEALIVEEDRHLDFRAGVACDGGFLRITTAVWLHGWRGRLYFAPVSVAHDPITRAMMRAAIRRVAAG